jgi:hypothetical protein
MSPGLGKSRSAGGLTTGDAAHGDKTSGNLAARGKLKSDMSVDVGRGDPAHGEAFTPEAMLGSPGKPPRTRKFMTTLEDKGGDASPRWNVVAVRRAACKLEFKDPTVPDAGDEGLQGTDLVEATFVNLAHKLQTWVGQANMQMNNLLDSIRKRHQEDATVLENAVNLTKLRDSVFSVNTACYYMSKWLYELDPKHVDKPKRPTPSDPDDNVKELLAEVQYGLSKMDKLGSELGPALVRIVTETKKMRRTAEGKPATETDKLAHLALQKRGIADIHALAGLVGHLEHLLDMTQSLAYRAQGVSTMGAAIKVLIAASRFKKLRMKKKAAA